jgi:hypothetical protein
LPFSHKYKTLALSVWERELGMYEANPSIPGDAARLGRHEKREFVQARGVGATLGNVPPPSGSSIGLVQEIHDCVCVLASRAQVAIETLERLHVRVMGPPAIDCEVEKNPASDDCSLAQVDGALSVLRVRLARIQSLAESLDRL